MISSYQMYTNLEGLLIWLRYPLFVRASVHGWSDSVMALCLVVRE